MEIKTINMQEFRNATKEKRCKGRPKLTEEEKERRIRSKAIRLSHINHITSNYGLKLSKSIEDNRSCFKWVADNTNLQKKLDKVDKYELIVFTNKLSKFTLDDWVGDAQRIIEMIS